MKHQSRFIKLPGERVNSAQVEAGVPLPDTYPAFFWIDREDIMAVMESFREAGEEMTTSAIYCKNGETFHCSLPADKVMALIDKHDREANIVYFNVDDRN